MRRVTRDPHLEVKRSKVKVIRLINAVTENQPYLRNGKAYELQTWPHHRHARWPPSWKLCSGSLFKSSLAEGGSILWRPHYGRTAYYYPNFDTADVYNFIVITFFFKSKVKIKILQLRQTPFI